MKNLLEICHSLLREEAELCADMWEHLGFTKAQLEEDDGEKEEEEAKRGC